MQSERDDSDPFFSKEPEIISSTGCEIYWKDGKDLTLKTLRLQKCEGPEGLVPKSVLYITKEASDYQYEESDEEVQDAEGGEEDSDEKPEEGPEKDLDPAEDSPRKPRRKEENGPKKWKLFKGVEGGNEVVIDQNTGSEKEKGQGVDGRGFPSGIFCVTVITKK
ncbi:hypothetical protein MG293_005140 [Ovis ammon polii]|uniref:Uncharacterized protein n=1 Tax=Ovis ammon polii TaxID=230172 RepID=A0AAD4UHR1_OVIAM|nr:hypothetical protein MG293_005140 [Ovis ammon polii]